MLETAVGISMVATSTYGIYQSVKDKIRERMENIQLNDYQLKIGYEYGDKYNVPIIVDMKRNSHLLIAGVSGSGKTRMVEYALKDKNVILLNAFYDDFETLKPLDRVNEPRLMKEVLQSLVAQKEPFEKPHYLVCDEILELSLSGDKEVSNLIMRLLATARHKNIYVIGISQSTEKEIIKFKHLFSNRVCFRMIEDSSYKTVLGYAPDETFIQDREFYYVSTVRGFGHTYDVGE